jgi:hypothetical protein
VNWKRLFWAALTAFVFLQITDFIIHWINLNGIYEDLANQGVFRDSAEKWGYLWVEILMTAIFSLFFTYIFAKGYEGKGILEGIRYGIIIGFFWIYVHAYYAFVILPIPYSLVWYWIIAGFIQIIIAGILLALIYRPKSQ